MFMTHYTGIGTEIRENYAGPAKQTKVVVNMPVFFRVTLTRLKPRSYIEKDILRLSNGGAILPKQSFGASRQGLGRYGIEDAENPDMGSGVGYIPNTKFEWYLKNHLGSTMLVYGTVASTDPNTADIGETKAAYDYRAFGEMVTLSQPSDKVTENFTGKELDDETKLSNHGARLLDPMLGVWISVDPKRFFPSPYLYMGNGYNPILFADLNGQEPGDGFDHPDYAAMDVGATYLFESSELNKEMGGAIYYLDGLYYATPWNYTDEKVYNASQSTYVDINAFVDDLIPSGAVRVADYHGHARYEKNPVTGTYEWNYEFSDDNGEGDIPYAQSQGRPLYLIPAKMNLPNGMGKPARVYDPKTNIDRPLKYVDSFATRREVNAHKIKNNTNK